MIGVTTPAGKRALAEALADLAPDVLETIKALSAAMGGTSAVYVELEEGDAELVRRMRFAKEAHKESLSRDSSQ